MNADLHMAGDLKNTGKGNLFVIFGEPDIDILPVEGDGGDCGQLRVRINGVDVFHPNSGEIRSDGAAGIACWFIDTDYNEESFFVRHAYFLGAGDPYKALRTTLKAEINEEAWSTLRSDTSRPVRPALLRPHRSQGHQPLGRRGDEGVSGVNEQQKLERFRWNLKRSTKVPVERLRLDRRNPRLHRRGPPRRPTRRLIARLYRSAELDELLQSISANGYMDIEPLVVMSDAWLSDNDTLVVLEGNRRLAALRLLREPNLAEQNQASSRRSSYLDPTDRRIRLRATLDEVSVYPVANRERARSVHRFQAHQRPGEVGRICQGPVRGGVVQVRDAPEGVDLDGSSPTRSATSTTRSSAWCPRSTYWSRRRTRGLVRLSRIGIRQKAELLSSLHGALALPVHGVTWVSGRHGRVTIPEPDQVPAGTGSDELRNVLVWIYGSKKDRRAAGRAVAESRTSSVSER